MGNQFNNNKFIAIISYGGNLELILKAISKELAINRQEFTKVYNTFTSSDLYREY